MFFSDFFLFVAICSTSVCICVLVCVCRVNVCVCGWVGGCIYSMNGKCWDAALHLCFFPPLFFSTPPAAVAPRDHLSAEQGPRRFQFAEVSGDSSGGSSELIHQAASGPIVRLLFKRR